MSALFLIVSLGNIFTTMMVIPHKLKEKVKLKDRIQRIHRFLHGHNGHQSEPTTPTEDVGPEGDAKESNDNLDKEKTA